MAFIMLCASIIPAVPVSAAGQALEILPPVVNVSANPGETVKTQVAVRNISTGKLVVTNEINDFTADGEGGNPKILLDTDETTPYSLKDWVRPLAVINLNARQLKDVSVTIDVPRDAAPGGYYAVVRFTGTAPQLDGTGVSLSASLGALIFLTVKGQANESMQLEEFFVTKEGKTRGVYESAPLTFVERIKNTGNIHQQPGGQVMITDMFGKKVAAVNVNLPPRNVLPGSTRRFEQPLDSTVIGNKILFGRYTAEMKITYGTNKQVLTAKTSFWVIPYKLLAIGIIGLIVAFLVLRTMLRRYNQHIIKQAQKRRR